MYQKILMSKSKLDRVENSGKTEIAERAAEALQTIAAANAEYDENEAVALRDEHASDETNEADLQGVNETNAREADADDANADGSDQPASPAEDADAGASDVQPYKVGPGKPPLEARFKKGQSGNPKGRPKGPSLRAILLRFANEPVDEYFARTREFDPETTRFEAAIGMLVRQAQYGSGNASRELFALMRPFTQDEDGKEE